MGDIDLEPQETMGVIATTDRMMETFIVRRAGKGPLPAIVLLHEGAGLDESIKDYSRQLAAEGFVAIAPDIRHRAEPAPQASTLDLARDVVAAVAYAQAEGRGGPVGVIGFGAGGFVAFLGACRADITVAVVVYGGGFGRIRRAVRAELGSISRSPAPVHCILGAEDALVDVRDVGTVRERLSEYRVPNEFIVYPRVGYGFMDAKTPAYRPLVAADAWQRTLAWLRATKRTGRSRKAPRR